MVDELDNGSRDSLTGLQVINNAGYRIPINYKVLQIVKGNTLDFVVAVQPDNRQCILFYDVQTSLIVYRMDREEACEKNTTEAECNLNSVKIH